MSAIATFGDNLKVFAYNGSEFQQTGCHAYKTNVKQLRGGRINWAGNYLVCAFEESGVLPILTNRNSILSVLKRPKHPNASAAAFLNWTNRSLVLGGLNGSVSVWDVKCGKTTVEFTSRESTPVKFLSINSDDVNIAAAGPSGVVRLYSCTTNRLVSTLRLDSEEEFSDLQFSLCARNHLGCSTKSGTVLLWDTNTGVTKTHFKSASSSACTGIVFSPANSNVMISVSLSQSLKVHDTREKKTVFEINMGKPLTCVDMLTSEPCVMMGTVDGYVITLDLRSSSPVGEVYAHKLPVTSLRSMRSSIVTKGKHFSDAQINTPDESSPVNGLLEVEVSINDIFSPLSTQGKHPSILNGKTPSPKNQPNLLNVLQFSPIEQSFKNMDGLPRSTPNAEQSNGFTSNSNFIDSFMAQIRTPVLQSDDDCESPILSHRCRSTDSLLNGMETPRPVMNIESNSPEARSSEVSNALLMQLMETVKTVSSELSIVKEAVNSLSSELAALKAQRENDRSLMLDIHDLILTLPLSVRMENLQLLEISDPDINVRR